MLERLSGQAKPASSQYRGVSLSSRNGRWLARMRHGLKQVNLGSFATEEEAAHTYDAAVRHLVQNM